MQEQLQPIRGEFLLDIITGTKIFSFTVTYSSSKQLLKPRPQFDVKRSMKNGDLSITSTTTDGSFRELQFKSLVLTSIREIFIEQVATTGAYVPISLTGRVVLTLKFRKFD